MATTIELSFDGYRPVDGDPDPFLSSVKVGDQVALAISVHADGPIDTATITVDFDPLVTATIGEDDIQPGQALPLDLSTPDTLIELIITGAQPGISPIGVAVGSADVFAGSSTAIEVR